MFYEQLADLAEPRDGTEEGDGSNLRKRGGDGGNTTTGGLEVVPNL